MKAGIYYCEMLPVHPAVVLCKTSFFYTFVQTRRDTHIDSLSAPRILLHFYLNKASLVFFVMRSLNHPRLYHGGLISQGFTSP